MKLLLIDYKDRFTPVILIGQHGDKLYCLKSSLIDVQSATHIKRLLKDKSLQDSIEVLKKNFNNIYNTCFRTYPTTIKIIEQYDL